MRFDVLDLPENVPVLREAGILVYPNPRLLESQAFSGYQEEQAFVACEVPSSKVSPA